MADKYTSAYTGAQIDRAIKIVGDHTTTILDEIAARKAADKSLQEQVSNCPTLDGDNEYNDCNNTYSQSTTTYDSSSALYVNGECKVNGLTITSAGIKSSVLYTPTQLLTVWNTDGGNTSLGKLALKDAISFSEIQNTPTTLAGYGITEDVSDIVWLLCVATTAPVASANNQGNYYYNSKGRALYKCVRQSTGSGTQQIVTFAWEEAELDSSKLYVDTNANALYQVASIVAIKYLVPIIGGTITNAAAKKWFEQVFDTTQLTGTVSCLSAHVIDQDTANQVATVRFTIRSGGIDLYLYDPAGKHCIGFGYGGDMNTCAFVVSVAYLNEEELDCAPFILKNE